MPVAELYPYQMRVYDALRRGKNVILQAPTGAGKTRAALYPYFENLSRFSEELYRPDTPLPLTCRYAVPMRVLASQFEREYRDFFDKLDRSRATELHRRYADKLGLRLPAIQTGEAPDDPGFESPLTFCTIDQLLASFIGAPFSVGPRLANMNVGAVAGSYLVLDEFHLYPLDGDQGARTTTLAMLRMLAGVCRFVLMTATLSTSLLDDLSILFNAEVVRVTDAEELRTIMDGRERTLGCAAAPMAPEAIVAAHEQAKARDAGATLVVCNTVTRAQDVYRQLKRILADRGDRDVRLMLLHSRFTPHHRREKSARLEEWLGKAAWRDGHFTGPDTIVVATQVVEVGLNISAGVLHTELAPASSIVQRAGRCARFSGQFGEVIVYPIPPREDGSTSYLPYDKVACEATWRHLERRAGAGPVPFGFGEEQELVDAVHTDEDRRLLQAFCENEGQIRRSIAETLGTHSYGAVSELIRNVTNVSVVIHDEPEQKITTRPFTWEAFQLHPGSLRSAWAAMQERRPGEWVMKQLVAGGDATGRSEDDNDREPGYTWDIVSSPERIPGALRLALPTTLAAYDDELGFRLLLDPEAAPGTWMSSPGDELSTRRNRSTWPTGRRGSYVEHITGLLRAYDWSVRREVAWVAARLEAELGLPAESVDEAIRLAIACHDIGKLAADWQRWAHAWQELLVREFGELYAVEPEQRFLAKTDRLDDWRKERKLREGLSVRRPNHACAGAVASAMLIGQRLRQRWAPAEAKSAAALAKAVISAIARHHAPTAVEYDTAAWDEAPVRAVIAEALAACRLDPTLDGLDLTQRKAGEMKDDWLLHASADSQQAVRATWLAFVLVRALRLCDQRADRDW